MAKNKNFDYQLAEEVQKYLHLYDSKHEYYRVKNFTANSWMEIAEALKTEPAKCKKTWKAVRDRYVKAKKRMKGHNVASLPEVLQCLPWLDFYVKNGSTEANITPAPEDEAQTPVNGDFSKTCCGIKVAEIGAFCQKMHLEELESQQNTLEQLSDSDNIPYVFKDKRNLESSLAEQVQKYPHLYDSRQKLYKSQPVTGNSWREIAETLGTNPVYCKKMWKVLCEKYVKAKKRRKLHVPDSGCQYNPFILKQLSWLDKYIKHGGTETNMIFAKKYKAQTPGNKKSTKAFQGSQQKQELLPRAQINPSFLDVSVKDSIETEEVHGKAGSFDGSYGAEVTDLFRLSVPVSRPEEAVLLTPCSSVPTLSGTQCMLPHTLYCKDDQSSAVSATVQCAENRSCSLEAVEGLKSCFIGSGLDEGPPINSAPEQARPRLSLSSLRLLLPPLRLMSAVVWHVAQQGEAMHYGKLEEFVNVVTEMVPGLLTFRQRSQLILGLQTRMVLELFRCENPPDPQTIQKHLDQIKRSTVTMYSTVNISQCRDELETAVTCFVDLIRTLLENTSEREHFFQVVFPVHYGPPYDTALQTLVWRFLSGLEETLSVPDFCQTASYLHSTPAGLDDFWMSHADPEQLKTLLQHHTQLKHPHKHTVVFNNCLEDTILSTLSLPQTHLLKSSVDACEELEVGLAPGAEGNNEQELLLPEVECDERTQVDGVTNLKDDSDHSEDVGKKTYVCSQCGNVFSNAYCLKLHLRVHSGERPYRCSVCEKSFTQGNGLVRHLKMHKGDRSHLCSVCGKGFLVSGDLCKHMMCHTGKRLHICMYCGKMFRTLGDVKIHERCHTGERPFACFLCPKQFISMSARQRHMRVHTDKKPFCCFRCGKGFNQKYNLRTHMRTHQK
ncbi:hypothetical protein UPYG_G00294730 [Umbra pygmaea]|uniref:Uncharacterized protein n=1 Tax=Umbra pygmaea TaxID=75934 RepID=A0ABD0W5E4_UMBPY